MSAGRVNLIVPDVHRPYHDVGWWAGCMRFAANLRPYRVIVIGDYVDNPAVSPHPAVELSPRLDEYLPEAAESLADLGRAARQGLWFCEGNHERWLLRYVHTHAEALVRTHPPIWRLLGVNERRWVPYHRFITFGEMAYTHDVGHAGKSALSASLDAAGHNVTFGHTHRGGTWYDGDLTGKRRVALNVGWGGDFRHVRYQHQAKCRHWQLGVGLVTEFRGGLVAAQFVPYVDGRFLHEAG